MSLLDRYIDYTKARWNHDALRDERLEWTSWGRTTSVDLSTITTLHWRTDPERGSVRIETSEGSRLVSLENFLRPERLMLIRLLRRIVPEESQHKWPEFCLRIAWPLMRSFDPPREPQPGDIHLTRRRWDVIGGIGTAATAGLAFYLADGDPGAIVPVLPVAGLWLAMRYLTPKEGRWIPADSELPGQKPIFLSGIIGLHIAAVFVGLSQRWIEPNPYNFVVAVILPLTAFGLAMLPTVALWRFFAPKQKAWKERKTAEALAEWNRRDGEDHR